MVRGGIYVYMLAGEGVEVGHWPRRSTPLWSPVHKPTRSSGATNLGRCL
jgi:hypothetical protein